MGSEMCIRDSLIGYSGGGAVATLLAAERHDIYSLRTVAGNLDHQEHSRIHAVSTLSDSLNPVGHVSHLRDIPQVHFVGAMDHIVPLAVTQSYMNALGDNRCARIDVVDNAAHEDGWVNRWPALLAKTPSCEYAKPATVAPLDDWTPPPAPIRTKRLTPSKP